MSQLPNAPLVEVIFETRWPVKTQEELNKCLYLHGDLYAVIKDFYPKRELLIPSAVPMEAYNGKPAHRFRAEDNYPLVQVGPGILTVNTIDEKYDWEKYRDWVLEANQNFLNVYDTSSFKKLDLSLRYIDFLPFEFEKENVFEFLEKKLHISLQQGFFQDQKGSSPDLNLGFHFNTDFGLFHVSINRGIIKNEVGILLEYHIQHSCKPDINELKGWLSGAYQLCSDTFKKMTAGDLYEAFNQQ